MIELDFESDQKLKALTEALRAGPGSPQWREAVSDWRSSAETPGGSESEHQLLMRVREHLASGKSYRQIRPGAGFTRRVMEGLDQDQASRLGKATGAGWIAGISALVIVAVVAVVAFLVWPRPRGGDPGATPRLDRTYFVTTVESATFTNSISPQWQTFGNLTLMADRGLRPMMPSGGNAGPEFKGGGIYWDRPLAAEQAFSVEVAVEVTRPLKDVPSAPVVQVFVTDERNFEGSSATSPHELVWTLQDSEGNVVLPDGRLAGTPARLSDVGDGGKQTVDVRIVVNSREAMVEVNQLKAWSGPHQLDPGKPRTTGVRFLARSEDGPQRVTVQSVRVMEPQGSGFRVQGSGK